LHRSETLDKSQSIRNLNHIKNRCAYSRLTRRIDTAQGRLEALYAKQGRSNQFATRDERDAHLRSEIESTETLEHEQHQRVEQMQEQVAAAVRELEDSTSRKQEVQAELDRNKQQVQEKSQEKDAMKVEMDEQTERRKSVR
jgi:structural maintenance of chromosome 3 (chondroitin sulfate proteoglycan 6)